MQEEVWLIQKNPGGQGAETRVDMVSNVNPNYNKGVAARKVLLGASAEVNCEIPLNRYSFFEELQDKLLPNMRIELNIEFDSEQKSDLERRS